MYFNNNEEISLLLCSWLTWLLPAEKDLHRNKQLRKYWRHYPWILNCNTKVLTLWLRSFTLRTITTAVSRQTKSTFTPKGLYFFIHRKLVFATYMLTLPCVFLASLTLVVFWLPPDRPDRTSLCESLQQHFSGGQLGFLSCSFYNSNVCSVTNSLVRNVSYFAIEFLWRTILTTCLFVAMSVFASFLLLLLILVEAAPPTASSVPTLGNVKCFFLIKTWTNSCIWHVACGLSLLHWHVQPSVGIPLHSILVPTERSFLWKT